MKKILFIIVGVAVIYTAGSWFTGYQGEKRFRTQLELANQQAGTSGLAIDLRSYNRGIFTSQVDVVFKPTNPFFPKGIEFTMASSIHHGPILLGRGFGFGLFDLTAKPMLVTPDTAMNEQIKSFFGESIGVISMRAFFSASYESSWDFQELKQEGKEGTFSLAPSSIKVNGHLDSLSGEGELVFGALDVKPAAGGSMHMSPLTGTFSVKNVEPGVNISDIHLMAEEIKGMNAEGITLALNKLAISQEQSLNNGRIDTAVKFDFDSLTGPVEVKQGYYHIAINQVDVAAIKAWTKALSEAPTAADPQAVQALYASLMTQTLPLFLQDGLALQVSIGAEFMGGQSTALWDIKYKAPADGKTLADIADPMEYLTLVDSDLVIKSPEALLQATPVSAYVGTYILQDAGNYVLKAGLHAGELTVGNTPVPREQILAAIGGMMAAKAAAQAPQEPAEEDTPEETPEPDMVE